MKKICLLAIAVGALLIPASASAKEITGLKVCGASGCADVDKSKLTGLSEDGGAPGPSVFNPAVGSFYTVAMSFGMNGETFQTHQTYWLADRNLLRGQEQMSIEPWWTAPAAQAALLNEAAAGLQPFTPQLQRVLVGRKTVADPSSYMRLLERYPHPRARPSKKARWIKITLRGTNPWVDGVMHMRYQPQRRVLKRESDLVKLPKALGRLVVRRLSLAQPATSGKAAVTSSGHTALYAGIGAAGLAAAGLALLLRRKSK
jgi:hypothetical protein